MIRSELLQALARENPELRIEDVERAVDTFFDEVADSLAVGGRVERVERRTNVEAYVSQSQSVPSLHGMWRVCLTVPCVGLVSER